MTVPDLTLHPQLVSHPVPCCGSKMSVRQISVTWGAPSGGALALLLLVVGAVETCRLCVVTRAHQNQTQLRGRVVLDLGH